MNIRKHMEGNINMDFRQVVRIRDAGPCKTLNCFGDVATSGCAATIIVN
jgi:hypothetical protein